MCKHCDTTAMRYSKPNVLCSEKLVIGVSRFYVYNQLTGSPTLEQIEREVDSYGIGWILCPLMTVWDTLISTTTEEIKLHQPECPCRSTHEQALLLALQALSNANPWMAHASLLAVAPDSSVRLILPELRKIVGRLACRPAVESRLVPGTTLAAGHGGEEPRQIH